jgi:DNA-binding XRE family transcriptional regulator
MHCEAYCELKILLDKVNIVYYYIIDMNNWTSEKIKELRTALKLTQKAFGELVGVTREYVNYLEKGVKTPSKTLQILLNCMETKMKKEDMRHGTKNKRSL